tara:strand:+ start:343 stop:1770 length:1428 start_codon:yes stop_codon:yes gene_type:complete
MAQNVSWKKLGQVNPKGDLYLLVVFDAIHTRRELEVESYGKALLTAPKEMLDDMEDVFNGDLPFDSVAKTDSFKNRWEGIKGAVLDVRKIGKTKPLGKIGLTKIVKTTEFGSNTGSGAGAKATEMFESATAWMTALAYKNNGIPSDYVLQADDFNQVKGIVDTTATMDASFKFLNNNADWMTSTIKTANILYEANEFKNTAFHFYRGKQIVNLIEKHFKQINKDAGRPFSNINKWTPADMYMAVPNIDKTLITDAVNFPDINNRMEKLLKDKKLIGVSLKRITSTVGGISKKNFSDGPPKQERKFTGVTAKSLFGSMDVYFTASPDKISIQFRATDTAGKTWQGEVLEGKEAKHGKIGGGVLDNILKKVLGNSNGLFARAGYSKTSAIASAANNLDSKILTLAESNKDMFTDTEDITLTKISGMPPKWKFAKYMGLLLADIMRTANDTDANDIATKLYLYATSESDESAPYIKVS